MRKSLFLRCLIAFLFIAPPALAIPVAGTYVFVSGPDIAGSFTSTGTTISAWSFHSDIFDRLFLRSPNSATQSWNNTTDILVPGFPIFNNASIFATNNGMVTDHAIGDPCCFAVFSWNANPLVLQANFSIHPTFHDAAYNPSPTVAFVLGLPEPDMLWPTLAGMIGIAVFAKRMRQQGHSVFHWNVSNRSNY
jgi:hypothetical protein